jgi:hypothetical protein
VQLQATLNFHQPHAHSCRDVDRLWAAIPPRTAAQLAVEAAEALDARLEAFPPHLLEEVHGRYGRWVVRALHRNEHLDEVEAAVQGR